MKHLSGFIAALFLMSCANIPPKLPKSHLVVTKKTNCYEGAAQEFTKWTYAGGKYSKGLYTRRLQEQRLFLKGCKNV
jgi:GH24 family phage-related lysozyme (muramidase)